MSINKTAYDTTALTGALINTTIDKIAEAHIKNDTRDLLYKEDPRDDGFKLTLIEGGNSSADAIHYFAHPLQFNTPEKDHRGQYIKQLAVDVRNYGKWYEPNTSFLIRNQIEYDWSINRAILNQIWINDGVNILRDISAIPACSYGSLISECVARRFALNPAEQAMVSVYATYFYYCLFTDSKVFEESEFTKIAGSIARHTRVPAETVFTFLEPLNMTVLSDLTSLCNTLRECVGSASLTDLNVKTLLIICNSTWSGNNAKEVISVGLEHPPTWIMIVHASIFEATFKRSTFNRISSKYDKGGSGDQFDKSVRSLLTQNTISEE